MSVKNPALFNSTLSHILEYCSPKTSENSFNFNLLQSIGRTEHGDIYRLVKKRQEQALSTLSYEEMKSYVARLREGYNHTVDGTWGRSLFVKLINNYEKLSPEEFKKALVELKEERMEEKLSAKMAMAAAAA